MPDWLRTAVWIVGVLALLLTLVVGYLMWRYRGGPWEPVGSFAFAGEEAAPGSGSTSRTPGSPHTRSR